MKELISPPAFDASLYIANSFLSTENGKTNITKRDLDHVPPSLLISLVIFSWLTSLELSIRWNYIFCVIRSLTETGLYQVYKGVILQRVSISQNKT